MHFEQMITRVWRILSIPGVIRKIKKTPKVMFMIFSFFGVTCSKNDSPVNDFSFLQQKMRKVIFATSSMVNLKRRLFSLGFSDEESTKLVKDIGHIIGYDWYDANGKIELTFIKNDEKLCIMQANFAGVKKSIKINYETSLGRKVEKEDVAQKYSVVRGFVTSNFEKMIVNQQEMPFVLRKNILKFAKDSRVNIQYGDRFYCLYDQQTYKVLSIFCANGAKNDMVVLFNGKSGTKMYSRKGVAISGERIVFDKPIYGARVSSLYGYRMHPILKIPRFHYGIDFAAPSGTPVRAPAPGVVSFVGTKGGYGRCLIIKHDHGVATFYAHLRSVPKNIHIGKQVNRRDVVALVGSSGLSTGPHLHYEIWVNGVKINPLRFAQEKHQMLKGDELVRFNSLIKELNRYFF